MRARGTLRLGALELSLGGASGLVLVVAAIKLLVTLAVSNRYGFHRDEMYYRMCGLHLSLGYVDFPPVTPVLARAANLVAGDSLVALRLLSILAGTVVLWLAARMARELGGSGTAQVLAALAVLLAPMYLGGNLLFQTVTFDQLAWTVVLVLVLRLLRTEDPRHWPPIGLAFGVGLEIKYTILALAFGLLAGTVLSPLRAHLRTPWPWLAGLIALLLLVPNLAWQVQHGWASLSYLQQHRSESGSRPAFVLEQLTLVGPPLLPLLLLGFVELFKSRRTRLLGWTCLVTVLALFLAGGKSYYAGPLYPLLFAAGSVRLASFVDRGRPRWARPTIVALLLLGVLAAPISIPLLPTRAMADTSLWKIRKDYADMVGWPDLAAQAARVYRGLPQDERRQTAILTWSYGLAGPIDLYGPAYGLPPPVSPHLTYYYWKPAQLRARTVIALGVPRSVLLELFRSVRQVGVVRNHLGIRNEEYGSPIALCRQPRQSLDLVWPRLQRFG